MVQAPTFPHFDRERFHGGRVAGVDEAGRAPLAGPVVAAAVVLNPCDIPDGLNDSKKLTRLRREAIYAEICGRASWAVGIVAPEEIDTINIYHASLLAMQKAVTALTCKVTIALIDGNARPKALPCPSELVIGGDAICLSIAAASIVAKVTRDRLMYDLAGDHPPYGWERNVGYPTAVHLQALRDHGVTPHHRRSFRPVREAMSLAEFALV